MRVGTDGVLLGAWADCQNASRILDVGTGTGLISLMLAQRSSADIDAVEVDSGAVVDAGRNFSASEWAERINLHHCSVQDFAGNSKEKYDLVVSNPPFFENSLKNPDLSKASARHTESLTFEELLYTVSVLLNDDGAFCVILPVLSEQRFLDVARNEGFYVCEKMYVKTTPVKQSKRLMMKFKKAENELKSSELIIEKYGRHKYSEEYLKLTEEFYLFA